MDLVIILHPNSFQIKILKKGQTIDLETVKYYHDLSDLLIACLDNLLRKNKLDLVAINSYKIQGYLGQNSTSFRIASAFIKGLRVSC